jgi:hypothetical protein
MDDAGRRGRPVDALGAARADEPARAEVREDLQRLGAKGAEAAQKIDRALDEAGAKLI